MLSRIKSLFTKLKMQISNSLKEEKEKRKINFTSTTSIHKKRIEIRKKKFNLFSFSYRQSRNQFTLEKV